MESIQPKIQKISGGTLGALPVLFHYIRKLRVKEIIDEAIPAVRSDQIVSHGECIIALLASIFLKNHALSDVAETLSPYDLEFLFQREGMNSGYFNDTRLGQTLDSLYGKTEALYGDVVFGGLREFSISVKRLHVDTTSVLLHGDYEMASAVEKTLFEKKPPLPAYGLSKDHRPDLKQLLFGLSVAEGGIPIYGRVADGNQNDVEEFRHHMEKLAGMLDDLRDTILVADCKLCTEETLTLANQLGFKIVTLVPENYRIRKKLVQQAVSEKELPLILKTKSRETYHGKSYEQIVPVGSTGECEIRRYLVVHSSQLENQKRETRKRKIQKERKSLDELFAKLGKMEFACIPDAEAMARKTMADTKAVNHEFKVSMLEKLVPLKRKRGRPASGEEKQYKTVFVLVTQVTEIPRTEKPFDEDGMFVLLTTLPKQEGQFTDQKILEAYKGQNQVEKNFHWLKGPLAVAPVFLNLPSRIDVLGFVYLISMFLYALVQRDVRANLNARGGKIMGSCRKKTDRPTTDSVFKLLAGISRFTILVGGAATAFFHHVTEFAKEILELMGWGFLYGNSLPCT